MKAKWYLYTLIVVLVLAGFNQQHISEPNQEIVVQFIGDEVTFDETQSAIATVKMQLQSIGVHNIQVGEEEEGKLKITYYSNIDIADIKQVLSGEKNLDLGYTDYNQDKKGTEFPFNKNSNGYDLDVYEIQNANDLESDFEGYALEQKTENDRFFTPNLYTFARETNVVERNKIEEIAYIIYKNNAIAINNTLDKIPEVRAGPISSGNS